MNAQFRQIILAVLAMALLIVSLRFFFPLFVLLAMVFFGFFFWYLYQLSQREKNRKALLESPAGRIQQKLKLIEEQKRQSESELEQIDQQVNRLRSRLEEATGMDDSTRHDIQQLLNDFEQQRGLRIAKLNFYRLGRSKLQHLLRQYEVSQELRESRRHLKQLSANRADDIAELEELKWDIEQDHLYLDSLEELEARLERSDSLPLAQGIQRELEQMSAEFEQQQRSPNPPPHET